MFDALRFGPRRLFAFYVFYGRTASLQKVVYRVRCYGTPGTWQRLCVAASDSGDADLTTVIDDIHTAFAAGIPDEQGLSELYTKYRQAGEHGWRRLVGHARRNLDQFTRVT